MRVVALVCLVSPPLFIIACNAILGIQDHQLASQDASPDAPMRSGLGLDFPPASRGIYTVGRVPDEASLGYLPDGGRVTLTDDGFEPGGTLCNGPICVTGAITP